MCLGITYPDSADRLHKRYTTNKIIGINFSEDLLANTEFTIVEHRRCTCEKHVSGYGISETYGIKITKIQNVVSSWDLKTHHEWMDKPIQYYHKSLFESELSRAGIRELIDNSDNGKHPKDIW